MAVFAAVAILKRVGTGITAEPRAGPRARNGCHFCKTEKGAFVKFNIARNLGNTDRILRAGFSLLMIYFGFFSNYFIADHLAGLILGGLGVGNLLIAIIGYCPMYGLVGFSTYTCKTDALR
jgi:hypothetical protein